MKIQENIEPKLFWRWGTSFRRNEAGASRPTEILQENKDAESALVSS